MRLIKIVYKAFSTRCANKLLFFSQSVLDFCAVATFSCHSLVLVSCFPATSFPALTTGYIIVTLAIGYIFSRACRDWLSVSRVLTQVTSFLALDTRSFPALPSDHNQWSRALALSSDWLIDNEAYD